MTNVLRKFWRSTTFDDYFNCNYWGGNITHSKIFFGFAEVVAAAEFKLAPSLRLTKLPTREWFNNFSTHFWYVSTLFLNNTTWSLSSWFSMSPRGLGFASRRKFVETRSMSCWSSVEFVYDCNIQLQIITAKWAWFDLKMIKKEREREMKRKVGSDGPKRCGSIATLLVRLISQLTSCARIYMFIYLTGIRPRLE